MANKLDFSIMIPFYVNELALEDIEYRYTTYGKKSLSKCEKYFLKYYYRFDLYMSSLPDMESLILIQAVETKHLIKKKYRKKWEQLISKHEKWERKFNANCG